MKSRTIHWNPPGATGRTRCGIGLWRVEWRTDPADATCNSCRLLVALDRRV